jgi:hypothetical protein
MGTPEVDFYNLLISTRRRVVVLPQGLQPGNDGAVAGRFVVTEVQQLFPTP